MWCERKPNRMEKRLISDQSTATRRTTGGAARIASQGRFASGALALCAWLALASPASPAFASGVSKPLVKAPPQTLFREGAQLQLVGARRVLRFLPAEGVATRASARLLVDMMKDIGALPAAGPYTLSIGRYPEFNARMAATAACSSDWDARRGRPLSQPAGPWLRKALAKGSAYSELAEALQAAGWRLRISSLESVLLCKAADIDFSDAPLDCAPSLAASARLPCGALVAFEIDGG